MKVLYLTLKKKWFDMIASGEKKEEYRDLTDYWGARLCYRIEAPWGGHFTKWAKLREGDRECIADDFMPTFQTFDVVKFRHGYAADAPTLTVEFKEIVIGHGKKEWGAEKESFIIRLGNILSTTGKPELSTPNTTINDPQ